MTKQNKPNKVRGSPLHYEIKHESCPHKQSLILGYPPVSRVTYLLIGFCWAKIQSSSFSRLNPVNSSSLSHGNVFLIAVYAHAGKGILLFPNNP